MLGVGLGCLLSACTSDPQSGPPAGSGGSLWDGAIAPAPASSCGSVRLTSYTAASGGWCEFDRSAQVLPDFARQGMTLAIAEPYNGSSYGGDPGQACGECWEISTITDTRIVMVHDLCPVQGNPLCAGAHFHFDLSQESAQALHGGGLDEAQARRIACPVVGNVHAQINDRNEWGYVRLAFVNHALPIHKAEYRATSGAQWRAVQRSGGAWHVLDDNETFAKGSPGGVFRLTSAQGQVLEMPGVLTYDTHKGAFFDLGAQLTDQAPVSGPACVFVPPATVYGDGYGGIDQVRWMPNPWEPAAASETSAGCYQGSCVRIDNLAQWGGLHIYYRQAFPSTTFAKLSLRVRALSGGGEMKVAPSHEGDRCEETSISVADAWSQHTIDVKAVCAGHDLINALTIQNLGAATVLLLDDIVFSP